MEAEWLRLAIAEILGAGAGLAASLAAWRLSRGQAGRPAWRAVAVGAASGVWAMVVVRQPGDTAASILLAAALIALALTDLATWRLPDVITLPLAVAGLAVAAFGGADLISRVIGAAAGFAAIAGLALAFRRFRGHDGIGLGDAKLLAAAGAWLGWAALPATVLLACVLAFAWAAARLVTRGGGSLSQPLAFGAPLAAAFWLVWLYGPAIAQGAAFAP